MTQIQIDLNDQQDQIVEIFKVKNKLKSKEEAIKSMIESYSECIHDWKTIEEKKYIVDPHRSIIFKQKQGEHQKIVERCKKCALIRRQDFLL